MAAFFSEMLTHVNSAVRIPSVSIPLFNGWVPTIDQIYRDNLRLLVKEAGSQEALSTIIEKSAAQISQWLNASKDSKTKKPRSMSRATAREIERRCQKPEGWMDQPHELTVPPEGADHGAPASPGKHFDAVTPEEQEFLDNWRILPERKKRETFELVAAHAAEYLEGLRELYVKHPELRQQLEKLGVRAEPRTASARAALAARATVAPMTEAERLQQSLVDDTADGTKH
jgi:hypothetical protein